MKLSGSCTKSISVEVSSLAKVPLRCASHREDTRYLAIKRPGVSGGVHQVHHTLILRDLPNHSLIHCFHLTDFKILFAWRIGGSTAATEGCWRLMAESDGEMAALS